MANLVVDRTLPPGLVKRLGYLSCNGKKSLDAAKNFRETLENALKTKGVTKIAFEVKDSVRGSTTIAIEAEKNCLDPQTRQALLSPSLLRVLSIEIGGIVEIGSSHQALDALLTGCIHDGDLAIALTKMLNQTDARIFFEQGLPPMWKMIFGAYEYRAGRMGSGPNAKFPDFIARVLEKNIRTAIEFSKN